MENLWLASGVAVPESPHSKEHAVLKDDDWWHGRNSLLLRRIESSITDGLKYPLLDIYTYLQIAFFVSIVYNVKVACLQCKK